MRVLESMTTAGKIAEKGARRTKRVMEGVAKGLTAKRTERATIFAKIFGPDQDKPKRVSGEEMRKKLSGMRDLTEFTEQVVKSVEPLDGAPQVQQALVERMSTGVSFLMEKMPSNPNAGTQLMGLEDDWEPSDQEKAEFELYVRAVNDPMEAVENVARGMVTAEEVEALQAVYPGIYSKLQETIVDAIVENGADIPYDRRIMLGTLFDVPTDPALEGKFLLELQSNYAADKGGRPAQGQAVGEAPKRKLDLNPNSHQTMAGNITNRDTK